MKHTYLTAVLGLTLALTAHAEPPQAKASAAAWYQRGMAAVKAGKPEEARLAFQKALQLKPDFTPAKYQLARIPELNARTKIARRKELFQSTIIKEINFQDATLSDALTALNQMATESTKEDFSPNFVIQDPGGKFTDRRVNLKMKNIPLAAALSYILEGVGAKAIYDEYATPIKPVAK